MARRAELNEHRKDHQMATVRRLKEKAGIGVVYDAVELDKAAQWAGTSNIRPIPHTEASSELPTTICDFIRALS
jgi:hypothetical protein